RAGRTLLGQAEIGLDVEQIVLDVRQHGVERAVVTGVEPREADHRVDLVQRAIDGDAQVVLLAPRATAERCGAVVTGTRVDPVENDHRLALFADRPDGQHYDDDRDELQQHAKPHQLLRAVGGAAPRHVGKSEQQHDRDGADRDRNEGVNQEFGHQQISYHLQDMGAPLPDFQLPLTYVSSGVQIGGIWNHTPGGYHRPLPD